MKHRFQKTAKRWLAMLLCVGMLCQPGLFSAFAQEGPASPAPGTVQSGAPSATPGEAPAAAPAAAAAPRAGTEYPLTNADFSLSGTLTIDGETPDENTVIQDGTKFNIRLEWKLPAGQAYTAEDTFTYTLPEAIPATSRSGDITNSGGEKIGTFSIDGRTVTIQYTQEFLNQSERSSWLNVSGEFQLEDIEAPGGTITIELPGKVWDDADDQDGLRPDFITLHLVADGEDTGKVLTLNEENGWSGTFSQLAEYAAGEKIAYTVVEDAVEGYTSAISGDAVKGYVITNTHTPAPTPTPVQPADPQTPSAGTPRTGDASMPALWLALTALSGTGFASVQIARIRARRRGR